MKEVFISLPTSQVPYAINLLCSTSSQAMIEDDLLWIRIAAREEKADSSKELSAWRSIAGAELFWRTSSNWLARVGEKLPDRPVPGSNTDSSKLTGAASWHRWQDLLHPLPNSRYVPADTIEPIVVGLHDSSQSEPTAAMQTSWELFAAYAENAPAIRLKPLRFAVDSHGEVLLLGDPLPPIPGNYFWMKEKILAPLGKTWRPYVEPTQLRKLAEVNSNEYLIWHLSGELTSLSPSQLATATLSAVRSTSMRLAQSRIQA